MSPGAPFTRLFVTLAGESLGLSASSSSGIGNYYEIELGGPATSADLLLTFPQSLPIDEFDVFFAGADETGNVGPFARLSFDVLQVGTGDVQVTLAWDADSDVDLHVIDPNGEEGLLGQHDGPERRGTRLRLECRLCHRRREKREHHVARRTGATRQVHRSG